MKNYDFLSNTSMVSLEILTGDSQLVLVITNSKSFSERSLALQAGPVIATSSEMIIAVLKEDEITALKPLSQGLTASLPLTSWLPWSWPWAQHPSREKESSTLYFGLRGRVCKEAGLSKCSCLEKGSFCGLGVEWEQIQWQSRSGKQNNSLGENLDKARSRSLLFSSSVVSNSL